MCKHDKLSALLNARLLEELEKILPWPVGVVLRPLLVTSRGSDLVRRMVFLVTDQIWTIVLAIFLNNCHSTRGNSSFLSTASTIYSRSPSPRSPVSEESKRIEKIILLVKVCAKRYHGSSSFKSIPCKTGLTATRGDGVAELIYRRESVFPDALGGVIHVSVFLPSLLQPATQFFFWSVGFIRKWFSLF